MTPPPGEDGGGLANAFMGSLLMVVLAVIIGTPIGVLAGTYLSEFARGKKLGEAIRFINDILLSAPSIIIGLFVYEVVVRPTGRFSGFAGGIALAFIFLPVVVRTTDEMLRLVPDVMREAAPFCSAFRAGRSLSTCSIVPPPRVSSPVSCSRDRPHFRRNRAAPLHGSEQPVLEPGYVAADGEHSRRHLPVRHEPL